MLLFSFDLIGAIAEVFFWIFFSTRILIGFGLACMYVWLMVSDYNKLQCDVMLNLLHNIRMRNMHICLPWECTCSGNSYFTVFFFMIYNNILLVHSVDSPQFSSFSTFPSHVARSWSVLPSTHTRHETNECRMGK